jgi:hypothetical protein
MNKITLTLISCSLLSNLFANEALNINDMFYKAKFSAELSFEIEKTNYQHEKDTTEAFASIELGYETATLNGLKASINILSNQDIYDTETGSVLNIANLNYQNNIVNFIIGKQSIEEIYTIDDDFEAIHLALNINPKLKFTLAYLNRIIDKSNYRFIDYNGDHGEYMGLINYKLNNNLNFNIFYSNQPKVANQTGGEIVLTLADFTTNIIYNTTNEDDINIPNGASFIIDFNYKLKDIALQAGYIGTDKNGGVGSFDLADGFNPLESGDKVSENDANTYYIGVSKKIFDTDFTFMYGNTDYDKFKEFEFSLVAEKELSKYSTVEFSLVEVIAEDTNDDYRVCNLEFQYKF